MWSEHFQAACKSLKLTVEKTQAKLCDLTLDLGDFPETLSYGLPSGFDQLRLLHAGDLSRVTFTPDGEHFTFSAYYLAAREMHVKHARVMEVVLTRKDDGDGVTSVEGKMVVRFWWSPEDLLFFAEGLSHEMQFCLTREQLSLPNTEPEKKQRPLALVGEKGAKA